MTGFDATTAAADAAMDPTGNLFPADLTVAGYRYDIDTGAVTPLAELEAASG